MSTTVFLIVSLLGLDPQFDVYVEKALFKPAVPFSLVYDASSLFTSSLQLRKEGFEIKSKGLD